MMPQSISVWNMKRQQQFIRMRISHKVLNWKRESISVVRFWFSTVKLSRMEAENLVLPFPTHIITKQRRQKNCRSFNLKFFGARTHHAGRIHSQDDGSIHLKQKMEHLRPERICWGKSRIKFTLFVQSFPCFFAYLVSLSATIEPMTSKNTDPRYRILEVFYLLIWNIRKIM